MTLANVVKLKESDILPPAMEDLEADRGGGGRKGGGNNRRISSFFKHFATIYCFLVIITKVTAIKNEFLPVSTLCQRSHKSFLSSMPRPIDGVVIESRNERDIDCVVTFQTESILERFMLRFEELNLDCNDHLYIFDGAHAIGSHRASISCSVTKHTVGHSGVIFTRTNFVTLKYKTDSWGTDMNGFKLVITAFKDGEKNGCRGGFQCDAHLCINKDLVCDTVNHCGDGEDERSSRFCSHIGFLPPFMDLPSMIAISLAFVLLLLAGVVAVWISVCRKNRERLAQERANSYQMSQDKVVNGVSSGRTAVTTTMTTTTTGTAAPPQPFIRHQDQQQQQLPYGTTTLSGNGGEIHSGNGIPPAVGRGYKNCFNQIRIFWREITTIPLQLLL